MLAWMWLVAAVPVGIVVGAVALDWLERRTLIPRQRSEPEAAVPAAQPEPGPIRLSAAIRPTAQEAPSLSR